MFLLTLSPATLKLLRSFIAPANLEEKSYKDLMKVLMEHFQPTSSETMQSFIEEYISRMIRAGVRGRAMLYCRTLQLKRILTGDASVPARLRDNNKGVQRRLLSESPLSFNKALSLAQGLETASSAECESAAGGAVATSQEEVHKVTSQPAFQNKGKTSSKVG